MTTSRKIDAGTSRTFAAVLLFGLLAMTARNATDPDLWWHLRTGEWIVQAGHVPRVDFFSFTRAGHAWIAQEWLSEVTFYELWKHGGTAALIIFSAVITTAGFMLLYLRCLSAGEGKRHWAAAGTALGALASSACWGVRPQMFTFALASLLLWLMDAGEERPELLVWIPPLFVLWLNLHAGFALGPALLLAYGIGLILETALGDTPWLKVRPLLVRTGLLAVACLALVPLNPNGVRLYRYPLDTLRSEGMRSLIGEWFSPDFHQLTYRPLLVVWLLLVVALAVSRARIRGRVLVPLLLTAVSSLDAVRHIPIFILVAIPVMVAAIPSERARGDFSKRSGGLQFRRVFNAAIVILIAMFALVKWGVVVRNEGAREAAIFPQAAITSMRTAGLPLRVFAYYDWGGYVIWNLYPDYRVFVDGRADLYGDELLREFKTAIHLQEGWREVLDGWKVDTVLVPPGCALAQALLMDGGWERGFGDSRAVVFVRRQGPIENSEISKDKVLVDLLGKKSEKNVSQRGSQSAKLGPIYRLPYSPRWERLTFKLKKESANGRIWQETVAQ